MFSETATACCFINRFRIIILIFRAAIVIKLQQLSWRSAEKLRRELWLLQWRQALWVFLALRSAKRAAEAAFN